MTDGDKMLGCTATAAKPMPDSAPHACCADGLVASDIALAHKVFDQIQGAGDGSLVTECKCDEGDD